MNSEEHIAKYRLQSILKYITLALPIAFFLVVVQRYALNVPRQDDYNAILYFLVQFKDAQSFTDKFALLMEQHNEHRIFTSRLFYATYYFLTGTINFRSIIYVNACVLIGVYAAIAIMIRRMLPQNWLIVVFVLGISLFDLDNNENANFAMAGMQNFGVILLFVLGLNLYGSAKKWALPFAILSQALVVFTSGNGILASACLTLFVWVVGNNRQRKIASLSTLLLVSPLYYLHYTRVNASFFTSDISKIVPFFLHVLGAHFGFESGIYAAVIMLVLFAILLPRKKRFSIADNAIPLVIIALFVLGSTAVMSVFRGNLPIENSFSSRYHIYSHLMVVVLFAFFVRRTEQKRWFLQATLLSTVFLLVVYQKNFRKGERVFADQNNVLKTKDFDYPDENRARMITDEACKRGIYCIDKERPANP